jgi:hypothetical protein
VSSIVRTELPCDHSLEEHERAKSVLRDLIAAKPDGLTPERFRDEAKRRLRPIAQAAERRVALERTLMLWRVYGPDRTRLRAMLEEAITKSSAGDFAGFMRVAGEAMRTAPSAKTPEPATVEGGR